MALCRTRRGPDNRSRVVAFIGLVNTRGRGTSSCSQRFNHAPLIHLSTLFFEMAHSLRLPQIDLSAILAQENPSIDLRVHTFENSRRNFLSAVLKYKNRGITSISDKRKKQAMEKKRILEKTHDVEVETNQCKLKEIDLVARA